MPDLSSIISNITWQHYFFLFFFYAILGWVGEVINASFHNHKFINRGFLIGPYCPIYGVGMVLITWLLHPYLSDPLVLFIMSIVVCAILEYFTSWLMEKFFHTRWWDYSKHRFNINGRIWLGTLIPFGFFGMIAVYLLNPFFINLINHLSISVQNLIIILISILLLVDFIISLRIVFNFKKIAHKIAQDSTEEINKKVRQVIYKKSLLYQRLITAFPDAKIKIKRFTIKIRQQLSQIEDNVSELNDDLKENWDDLNDDVKENLIEIKKILAKIKFQLFQKPPFQN